MANPTQSWRWSGVPVALLFDLANPTGPDSTEILRREQVDQPSG